MPNRLRENTYLARSQMRKNQYSSLEAMKLPYLNNHSKLLLQQQQHHIQLKQLPQNHQSQPQINESKVASATQAGQTVQGITKINQDSVIIDRHLSLFGIADGHGYQGERVSGFLKQWIPRYFGNFQESPQSAFTKSFAKVESDLVNSQIDTNLAGSTLVMVHIESDKLTCANVGDSRAVMGRYVDNQWFAVDLSHDQKPSVESEAVRIMRNGGRIAQQTDMHGNGVGPLRVWMKNLNLPGLAMTRSFGDKFGIQAGVTAQPEILEFKIQEEDKFVIIASDGVWEHLSSQDVIKFIGQLYSKGETCEQIAEKIILISINVWKQVSNKYLVYTVRIVQVGMISVVLSYFQNEQI